MEGRGDDHWQRTASAENLGEQPRRLRRHVLNDENSRGQVRGELAHERRERLDSPHRRADGDDVSSLHWVAVSRKIRA